MPTECAPHHGRGRTQDCELTGNSVNSTGLNGLADGAGGGVYVGAYTPAATAVAHLLNVSVMNNVAGKARVAARGARVRTVAVRECSSARCIHTTPRRDATRRCRALDYTRRPAAASWCRAMCMARQTNRCSP